MRNVHERIINAPAEEVGALLDRLGSDDDPLWPSPAWQPMRFDRPLQVGADGGHGEVKYWVSAHEPGRRVEFTFHSDTVVDGYHEVTVEPIDSGRCMIRHVLEGQAHGAMRIFVPLVVRWLHDAVLEDMFDNAELATTGRLSQPARWSPWVRLWRRLTEFAKPRAVDVPEQAELARNVFDRIDFSDAWQVPLLPGATTDPEEWAAATFRTPPRWVAALLRLRNGAVRLVGIEPDDTSAFDTLERTAAETLLGTDDKHLDFRASVLVQPDTVTLTTVTKIHNRRGRFYMGIVARVHPRIVRGMLNSAQRRLSERPKQNQAAHSR